MGKFWVDYRWGREKVAFWRTKAAISLKHVKIEEKLLWTAYRNSPTLFRTVPAPTPYGLRFLEIGVCNLATPSYLRNRWSYGLQIWRVHLQANPNKSLLKILEKKLAWAYIQGLPKVFGYPLLSQERVKLRTSNFVGTFIGSIRTKAHENVGNRVALGLIGESRKFSGHTCIGRIARSSLL